MAAEPTRPDLFNPMLLWADLGLRALESSVSSTQKIGDTVERMARAGAGPKDDGQSSATPSPGSASGSAAGSAMALVGQMHRSAFDVMQQGWLQWMSTLGTFASLTAGRGFSQAGSSENKAAQGASGFGLSSTAAADAPAVQSRSATLARAESGNSSRHESRAESRPTEHAHAAGTPKRRRGTGAKPKVRSRNS